MDILVVDDHEIIYVGLLLLLTKNGYKVNISNATNGEEALNLTRNETFDLIVLDINLPNTDTLYLLELLLVKAPNQKILMYSTYSEKMYSKQYMAKGAYGYLNKSASHEELLKAIVTITSGKKYLSDDMKAFLFDSFVENKSSNIFELLSDRELEITKLLLKGLSNSSISKSLHLHSSTISTYKLRIFEKLEVTNIIDLRNLAESYKLI